MGQRATHPPLRFGCVGSYSYSDPPAIRPRRATGVVMSRKRASLHAENRHPHAARGSPNFQPSGPLSSPRFRPQDGLRPLCFVQSDGMSHSAGQITRGFATGGETVPTEAFHERNTGWHGTRRSKGRQSPGSSTSGRAKLLATCLYGTLARSTQSEMTISRARKRTSSMNTPDLSALLSEDGAGA